MRYRVLYLSFMGMTEPLGRSQVLSYVEGLARLGWSLTVLSFEKTGVTEKDTQEVMERMHAAGIEWDRLRYHEGGGSAGLVKDLGKALARVSLLCARRNYDLLHCRSYLAATVGHLAGRTFGVPYLFDIRSFWLDEKVEAGVWDRGRRYRVGKRIEPQLYRHAAGVVSLTGAATRHFAGLGLGSQPVAVIPTCVDVDAYAASRASLEDRPLVFGYVGSFGERYLIEPVVEIFAELLLRRASSELRVLTRSEPGPLFAAMRKHGVPESAVRVSSVEPAEVPAYVGRMTATFSLIKPGYASSASCPTKFAESLAAGCPVVVNPGIGDCAELVEQHRVGVVADLEAGRASAVADQLLELLEEGVPMRGRCVQLAEEQFSVESGVRRYDEIYRSIVAEAASDRRRRPTAPSVPESSRS